MGLFDRKKKDYPKMPAGNYMPVLRCSICTGEQVLCARDEHGGLHEIMLIKSPVDIEGFCAANGMTADQIEKVY